LVLRSFNADATDASCGKRGIGERQLGCMHISVRGATVTLRKKVKGRLCRWQTREAHAPSMEQAKLFSHALRNALFRAAISCGTHRANSSTKAPVYNYNKTSQA